MDQPTCGDASGSLNSEPRCLKLVDILRTRYLSQEEAGRLLDACNTDLRIVVLAALHTGFRESELKALKWADVDFVNSSVTIAGA